MDLQSNYKKTKKNSVAIFTVNLISSNFMFYYLFHPRPCSSRWLFWQRQPWPLRRPPCGTSRVTATVLPAARTNVASSVLAGTPLRPPSTDLPSATVTSTWPLPPRLLFRWVDTLTFRWRRHQLRHPCPCPVPTEWWSPLDPDRARFPSWGLTPTRTQSSRKRSAFRFPSRTPFRSTGPTRCRSR